MAGGCFRQTWRGLLRIKVAGLAWSVHVAGVALIVHVTGFASDKGVVRIKVAGFASDKGSGVCFG